MSDESRFLRKFLIFLLSFLICCGCDLGNNSAKTISGANQAEPLPTGKPAGSSSNVSDVRTGPEQNVDPHRSGPSVQIIPGLRKVRCSIAKSSADRHLCNAVMSKFDKEDEPTYQEFEVTARDVDLNEDGHKETVAWISSWGGTSGQYMFILSKTRTGYGKLFKSDSTWTPIILLESTTDGWHDLAFLITGGGVEPHYVILTHDGIAYKIAQEQRQQPEGEILIDKKWDRSVFGPIQNQ